MTLLPKPDRTIIAHRDVILRDLQRLIGAQNIIATQTGRLVFQSDGFTDHSQLPLCVVMPTTSDQVVQIMKFAKENRVKIVPRGAGTASSGAAMPSADAIVICLSKMDQLLDIDISNRTVSVEAGATNGVINQMIAEHGFFFAPDPRNASSSTIAGNLAMDASGPNTLKYGTTSNHVLGLTMVLMGGEIIELGGQHLDAPGYDLLALITGSEGQVGIITKATFRILRKPEAARPILLGFGSVLGASQCAAAILKAGIVPKAIEFMDKAAIAACEARAKAGYPLDVEAMLIVEVEGSHGEISSLQSRIVDASRLYGPSIVRVSQNDAQSAAIWKGRRAVFSAMDPGFAIRTLDATIPLGRLGEILEEVTRICAGHNLHALNIFHAGDGNLHPLILYDARQASARDRAIAAGEEILHSCVEVGGCLSGQSGIGIEKRELMNLQFSDADLNIQSRMKAIFDPDWLLNPAKVFPLSDKAFPISDHVKT